MDVLISTLTRKGSWNSNLGTWFCWRVSPLLAVWENRAVSHPKSVLENQTEARFISKQLRYTGTPAGDNADHTPRLDGFAWGICCGLKV